MPPTFMVVKTVKTSLIMMFPSVPTMVVIPRLPVPVPVVPRPPVIVEVTIGYPMIDRRHRDDIIRRNCLNIRWGRWNDIPRSSINSRTIPGSPPKPVPEPCREIETHSTRNQINRLSFAWNNHHLCWFSFNGRSTNLFLFFRRRRRGRRLVDDNGRLCICQ